MNKILRLKESGRSYYIVENPEGSEHPYTFYKESGDVYLESGLLISSTGNNHVSVLDRATETETTLQQWIVKNRNAEEALSSQAEPIRLAIETKGEVFNIEKRYYAKLGKKFYQSRGRGHWVEIGRELYRAVKGVYDREIKDADDSYQRFFKRGATTRTSVDSLRALVRYIAIVDPMAQPPMTTAYKLSFHDCDGRTAVVVRLDAPLSDKDWEVKNEINFCYNAPVGYLSKHKRL